MGEKETRNVEKVLTKSVLAEITMLCEKQSDCRSCPLREGNGEFDVCMVSSHAPMAWNLEKIAEAIANAVH